MKNAPSPHPSVMSNIMRAVGLRPRRDRFRKDLWLFGMSGTIGRGDIRHCNTWELSSDLPPSATPSREVRHIAERRRQASLSTRQTEFELPVNDFSNR